MKKGLLCSVIIFSMLLLSSLALAQPNVEIKIKAEKETTVVKNGQKTKKMIPVKKVTSGETIQYTLSYKNGGKEAATNVVISDPIPEGTTYIAGSASEAGDLTFSVDKGKTFNKAPLLTYEVSLPDGKKDKRVAGSEQYTDIRWVMDTVQAGASDKVSFKVKVK